MYSKCSSLKPTKIYIRRYCPLCEKYTICPIDYKCDDMVSFINGWIAHEDMDNDNTNNGDQ